MNKAIIILDSSNGKVVIITPIQTGWDFEDAFNDYCNTNNVRQSACEWMEFDGTISINP